MVKTVLIHGRLPAISRAELESLYSAESLTRIGDVASGLALAPDEVNFDRLGGSVKMAKVLTKLPYTDWNKISDYLVEHVPKHTCCYGPGKLTFGISAYGLRANEKSINACSLAVKKVVRESGRPVRVVPTKGTELSSAQIIHNHMTDLPLGMELLLVRDGNETWLAQTVAIQDIEAYGARDQARPKRDARVGMLPPKLAQTIVNLAVDGRATNTKHLTVLDPFCGTGVLLQEALLMGYGAYGTDLEPRMVEYSQTNLDWLGSKFKLQSASDGSKFKLEQADATDHQWAGAFDVVATETYLGRPFSSEPKPEVLREVMQDVDTIHKKFLRNIANQTKPGLRMAIAVPAWKTKSGFKHLPVLDHLTDMGYTRLSFVHASNDELIYHREGQIVARELVTLIRK